MDDGGAPAGLSGGNDQPHAVQPAEAPPQDIGNTETYDHNTEASWQIEGTNVTTEFSLTIPSVTGSPDPHSAQHTPQPAPVGAGFMLDLLSDSPFSKKV